MGLNTAIATRVNGTPPPEVPIADIELGSLDFWALDDDVRDGAFATLRREAPISFWPTIELPGFVAGNGHWALTKYDDVFYASRHPDIFSSYPNITINDQTPELAEYFGSMIVLDDPRHQRLRSIVSRAFTPKVVARIEAAVRDRAHRLVSSMIANNPDRQADLVSELAGPLPLQIICDMMGIPKADHQRIFHWTNVILGFGDPDLATDFDEFMQVSADIGAYATALAEDRRVNHHDDLTSSLVEAEVDGERLSSREIASFFILLVVAGNETTRNAITHGVLALSRYPEQRDRWWTRSLADVGVSAQNVDVALGVVLHPLAGQQLSIMRVRISGNRGIERVKVGELHKFPAMPAGQPGPSLPGDPQRKCFRDRGPVGSHSLRVAPHAGGYRDATR